MKKKRIGPKVVESLKEARFLEAAKQVLETHHELFEKLAKHDITVFKCDLCKDTELIVTKDGNSYPCDHKS